jgi:hypothetical protein
MDLDTHVIGLLRSALDAKATERQKLNAILRVMAKWRSTQLQAAVVKECGTVVQSGPFKGMRFLKRSSEGCHVPKLLGSYEQELHPHIEAAIARDYRDVIVIGMAEGYYAVGFAMRMPNAKVHAFDIKEKAHDFCHEVARLNHVSERVAIGGLFEGDDFSRYPERTLVFCDIEGAEDALINPDTYPALRNMDVIVELHECFKPGIAAKVCGRFASSHDITMVQHAGRDVELPKLFDTLGDLDQMLAVWEWRTGPTPWAVMTRKA